MLTLDLQLNQLKKILQKQKANRFFLELPEGLKHKAFEIINHMKDIKKEFVLSIDTTVGACDIHERDLKKADCQAIIHFGHTKFIDTKQNVIYWPCYYLFSNRDVTKAVKNIEKKFKNKKITIVGPIQYKNIISEIIKQLKINKKLTIILGNKTKRLAPTQILGCDYSSIKKIANKLDAIIYIGDGNFHFKALQNLKAYKYNFNGKFETIKKTKKPKYDPIFLKSKRIGIYVSSKIGQNKIKTAEKIAQKLGLLKKEHVILYGNEINNEKCLGLGLDLIINTACPRISDDYKNYVIPIIDYKDFLELYKKYY